MLSTDSKGSSGRHISGSTIAVLVRYVERVGGAEAVRGLVARAGDTRPLEEITSLAGWSTYPQACALFEAARDITGDPDVGFRIGEEMLRQHAGTEVAALLRSLGSPGELLRNVAATGSKYSTVTRLEALHVGEWSATVSGEAMTGFARHRLLCDYTAGVLSQVSPLFGMDAAVVEEVACQIRGAPRCVYEVSWGPVSSEDGDSEQRIVHLEAQLEALTERFEALQATAAEMVSATDVDTLLTNIARRAGLAVRAPAHILVVRLPGEADLRIHGEGIAPAEHAQLADDVLQTDLDTTGNGRLVVDVASARHHYGRLAALYPAGAAFFAQERRLLSAFASQAAAALDTATALQEVSRRNDTARAVLALATELAAVGSKDETASRIARVMPSIVGCDTAAVFLWDRDTSLLSVRASVGMPEPVAAKLRTVTVSAADTPLLQGSLTDLAPFVLDRGSSDPFLRGLLELTEQEATAVVPIYAGEEFFGVVTAGVHSDAGRLRTDENVMERLTGLAAHAATALRNAALLDEVSHRAMHDPLTGLPNRLLLRDRLGQALVRARRSHGRVGVLVIDLDGFKQVNDTYGHAAGDAVLTSAGDRVRAALRPSDTVARFGGDEFAVVLPDIADADACETVSRKLLSVLQRPIVFDGCTCTVTASIGAVVGSGHDSYDTLLKQADAAMYHAKEAGGNICILADPEASSTVTAAR